MPRRQSDRPPRDGSSARAAAGEDVHGVRSYYDRILPFYEKEAVASAHLQFWRGLARRLRPGGILEIGSGLGRITAALSREAPSFGVDVSLEMLRRAVSRARGPGAHFVAADMRKLCFARRFDLIVAPSDPLSHLSTLADRRRALRAAAGALSPSGAFVLEGLYRKRRETILPRRRIRYPGGVLHIDEAWFPAGVHDLWHAQYRYLDRKRGKPDESVSAAFVARAWNPATLRALFRSCGLRVESLWGDFDRRPFWRGADRIVVVARLLSAPSRPSRNPTRRARSSR